MRRNRRAPNRQAGARRTASRGAGNRRAGARPWATVAVEQSSGHRAALDFDARLVGGGAEHAKLRARLDDDRDAIADRDRCRGDVARAVDVTRLHGDLDRLRVTRPQRECEHRRRCDAGGEPRQPRAARWPRLGPPRELANVRVRDVATDGRVARARRAYRGRWPTFLVAAGAAGSSNFSPETALQLGAWRNRLAAVFANARARGRPLGGLKMSPSKRRASSGELRERAPRESRLWSARRRTTRPRLRRRRPADAAPRACA